MEEERRFDPQMAARAFEGATIEDYGHPLRYQVHKLGKLRLPTGAVVAADALVFPDSAPFTRRVPPGRYPVDIALAHLADGYSYIAFARLTFDRAVPVSWELALTEADAAESQPPEKPGYGVDSGTGCFMDARTGALAVGWFRGNELLRELLENRIIKKMDARRDSGACAAIVRPVFWRLASIAFFNSGRGDGLYASSFGLDASGKAVQLITDFRVRNPKEQRERAARELL